MSKEEKAALDARAARAGRICVGEFVRRAVEAYDEGAVRDASELRVLLDTLAGLHEKTLRGLDRVDKKLDVALADLTQRGPPR